MDKVGTQTAVNAAPHFENVLEEAKTQMNTNNESDTQVSVHACGVTASDGNRINHKCMGLSDDAHVEGGVRMHFYLEQV